LEDGTAAMGDEGSRPRVKLLQEMQTLRRQKLDIEPRKLETLMYKRERDLHIKRRTAECLDTRMNINGRWCLLGVDPTVCACQSNDATPSKSIKAIAVNDATQALPLDSNNTHVCTPSRPKYLIRTLIPSQNAEKCNQHITHFPSTQMPSPHISCPSQCSVPQRR
jgi:hypothetical protein